jgi:hypothetical protein
VCGLAEDLEALLGEHPAAANATRERFTEWVAVLRHGTRLAAATIEGEGGYRITATATAVLASALLDAVAKNSELRGCFDPQELFTLQQLDPHLRQAGINILHHEAPSSAAAQPVGRALETPHHPNVAASPGTTTQAESHNAR